MSEENTTQLYERVRQEIKRKRDAKVAKAISDADAEAKIGYDALSVIATLIDFNPASLSAPTSELVSGSNFTLSATQGSSGDKTVYPTSRWVSDIIDSMNGDVITQPVVYDKLLERHPEIANRTALNVKSQISGILKKMTGRRELVVAKEPHGGYPTEYRKPNALDAALNASTALGAVADAITKDQGD